MILNMEYRKLISPLLIAVLITCFAACREEIEPPLPADEDPAISLLAPASNNFLKEAGEDIELSLQLYDNEALKLLRVTGRVYSETDSIVGDDFVVTDIDISGTNLNYDLTLTAPNLPAYYKIRYMIYAIDSKGAEASAIAWLTILPTPIDPAPFQVLTYENDFVFNRLLGIGFGFNFTNRETLPNPTNQNPLELDIAEVSSSLGAWEPVLESPNNEFFGNDSVFVITDESRFNYNEATYETISQAFFSDPLPSPRTPVLKEGDYVIVRLTKAPKPQFAVMKITTLEFDGGGAGNPRDKLFFDYLVTSQ
ncbi:MAG: hypothetical protein AAF927_07895 [Bacteroidota bacterium]